MKVYAGSQPYDIASKILYDDDDVFFIVQCMIFVDRVTYIIGLINTHSAIMSNYDFCPLIQD